MQATNTSEIHVLVAREISMLQRTTSCELLSDVAVLVLAMTPARYTCPCLCNTSCSFGPADPQPQPSSMLVRSYRTIRSRCRPRSRPHSSSRRGRITGELRRRCAHSRNDLVHFKVIHLPVRLQESLRVVGNEDVAGTPRFVCGLHHRSALVFRRNRQRDLPSGTHASGKCFQHCCRRSPCFRSSAGLGNGHRSCKSLESSQPVRQTQPEEASQICC